MNEPEANLPSRSVDSETCEDLRRQINVLFGALVVTSFSLTAFLTLEATRASTESNIIEQQAGQMEQALSQDNTTVHSIYSKFQDFGRTHPDFQTKILSKYTLTTTTTNAAPKK